MPVWTNASVRAFAGDADPIAAIASRSRAVVMAAVQDGWKGPPFDPFALAALLRIAVVPTEDVKDARVVARGPSLAIEFNPNRPRTRVRFSVAHEIAHTLFPDCFQLARNRGEFEGIGTDGWQLELLCNLAASEFLMPAGEDIDPETPPSVESLLDLQLKFDVSMEAVAIRLARVSSVPFTMAVATRVDETAGGTDYRIDYSVPSRNSGLDFPRGARVRGDLLAQCSAVGYTAKGIERLAPGRPPLEVECIGIPPYPGMTYPRVICVVRAAADPSASRSKLKLLHGNALEPRGRGPRIIAQVVNDATPTWGGGFALAAKELHPSAQAQFRDWATKERNLSLGRVHLADLKGGLYLASLVAQKGYGPSHIPRIRYAALRDCLDRLAKTALDLQAEVHMPQIGAGLAGGNWVFIREMVDECLVRRGVPVTIYTLPGRDRGRPRILGGGQTRLDEAVPEEDGKDG